MAYGVDTSRYHENKRAVEDKYIGPLVKTSMNRCIHCTRCVRFATEVAGVRARRDRPRRGHGDHDLSRKGDELGAAGQCRRSLPGRRADLQALRISWRARGRCQDRIGRRDRRARLRRSASTRAGREVMRMLPRVNEAINEEWISDKTRHVVDGLRRSGSTVPMCASTASCSRRPGRKPSPPSRPRRRRRRHEDRRHRRRSRRRSRRCLRSRS